MTNKTSVTKGSLVNRKWYLVDLSGKTLGRICTEIAAILIGKDKTTFSYHRDDGDYVVAINAKDVQVTGRKPKQKLYQHYTGYHGGIKEFTFTEMMNKDPRQIIMHGVKGMLPKNKLRDRRMTRLKVFVDGEHKYADKISK
ncbi:MAG: 50S ribosomal protein L13 [Candidatus Shapirobacteria bacterium]|jgi:large subunit ribosomal protein L13